jgi:peptide/nickel transport system substrate-binding protein
VKGRNPFKDLRVRKAVYHAINVPLIIDKVLRGQAQPTGAFLSPLVDGSPAELDKPPALRPGTRAPAAGRSGLPERLCHHAGLRQRGLARKRLPGRGRDAHAGGHPHHAAQQPQQPVLSQAQPGHGQFVEFGWTASPDAWNSLNGLFRSFDRSGLGTFNAGRYSNTKLDSLIDSMRTEPDLTRRRAMVSTVLRMVADELPLVPLYRRTLSWAMARQVQAQQWPNDTLELRWVRLK